VGGTRAASCEKNWNEKDILKRKKKKKNYGNEVRKSIKL